MVCIRFLFLNKIRKIRVDDRISLNELKQKCCSLFDLDANLPIRLSYRLEEEQGQIYIETDSKLQELVKSYPYLLVLHATLENEGHVGHAFAPDPVPHLNEGQLAENPGQWGVICNICEQNIVGTRYRCISCPDFELCSHCLRFSSLAHSPHHYFAQLMDSTPLSPNPLYAMRETVSPARGKAEEMLKDTKSTLQNLWGTTRDKANELRNSQQFQDIVTDAQTGLQNVSSWVKQMFAAPAEQQSNTGQTPLQMQPIPAEEQPEQTSSTSSSAQQQEEESNQ